MTTQRRGLLEAAAGRPLRSLVAGMAIGTLVLVACPRLVLGQTVPQPTALQAVHRSGQTFLTWSERVDMTGERYRVYRHSSPITATNLGSARRL
ncbi:MAG: hypothetical protein MUF10_20275, partial [Thermoanaerobaculaceae bacterium]|nr:hypothetical protein [Thermoanaerobaculaceae bacterium]